MLKCNYCDGQYQTSDITPLGYFSTGIWYKTPCCNVSADFRAPGTTYYPSPDYREIGDIHWGSAGVIRDGAVTWTTFDGPKHYTQEAIDYYDAVEDFKRYKLTCYECGAYPCKGLTDDSDQSVGIGGGPTCFVCERREWQEAWQDPNMVEPSNGIWDWTYMKDGVLEGA